uniref:GAIN-B domain-containing protein n=1 Tax=Cyprinus carpio TaxID=7962 RepID=A0A8C1U2H7_CYPCA
MVDTGFFFRESSMQSKMNIILHLTALLLLIIISNVAIDKSQGHRYCSPLANASYCTNSSSHVDCREHSCKAYSCILQSPGCSCMIASYNCSSSCNYEAPPNFCSCTADTCLCLNDMMNTLNSTSGNLTAEDIVNFVDRIANMAGLMSTEVAENFLKIVDATQIKVSELVSAEDKSKLVSYGNTYLKVSERLVSALVTPTQTHNWLNISLSNTEGKVFMVGPQVTLENIPRLDTTNSSVDIDLIGIAKNNNETGSAAVAFMSYNTMENLLKPDFFNTSNDTIKTMMSTVISATLPKTTNTKLTKPVNFTLRHIREFDPSGSLFCVYWNISEWIVDGCSVLKTNSSYTVCSCDHLSTFALIMQTSRPP